MTKDRVEIIDALRGCAVILMVVHHFLYDLTAFLGAPEWLFFNPIFDFLHYIFAGLFILLSGVSSQFSRSNVRRGIKAFAIALVISVVTYIMDMPIRFGVLHLLGFCMVFYGLTQELWDGLPKIVAPILYVVLLVGTALCTLLIPIDSKYLWAFGWTYEGFFSADYFPILPWIFVFLMGTWAGYLVKERKFPEWVYSVKVPVLPQVGRKALIIYVLHQPVLYGITMAIKYIFDI